MLRWKAFSNMLPRISASKSGERGHPPRFMMKPMKPIEIAEIQSPIELPPNQAPMSVSTRQPGTTK